MQQRVCQVCGGTFSQIRGRPAPRCGPCQIKHRNDRKKTQRNPVECAWCGETFQPELTGRIPLYCQPCRAGRKTEAASERTRRWRERNPDQQRAAQLASYHKHKASTAHLATRMKSQLSKYGLTVQDYERLVDEQAARCAICGSEHRGNGKRLHVDHDHVTGKARGLLCGPCNVSLGGFGDDVRRLQAAIDYLSKHQQR